MPSPVRRRSLPHRPRPSRDALTLAIALVAPWTAGCGNETPQSPPTSPPQATQAPATAASAPQPAASTTAAPTGAASAAPAATAPGTMPDDLNVLVVTVDSMRADMPWNGYERDIAPNLTAFEKKSTSYTRFYSISSYTAMSLGGFLAGRYPSELERSGYFFGNYPDSVLMFPELLQKAGVRTLTAHAHFYFDQKAGFRQGFDVYKILPNLEADNTTDKNVTSPQHLATAMEILGDKANTGKRFFSWFHFLDPHDVYMRHDAIDWGKKTRDLYDGEITFVDKHLQKLFDFVASQEWGKRTAIIVSSDHGDAFGEHKMFRHGFEVWDVLVHVPLMIQTPGGKARRIDQPRSAIDLAPTILEMLGVASDPAMQGKSLVGELYGKEPEERDVIVDLPRTSDNDRRRALVHGKYKLLVYGDDYGFDLFDIVADPGETKDLKRDMKDVFEDMKSRYKARAATIKDVCPKHTDKLKGKGKRKRC